MYWNLELLLDKNVDNVFIYKLFFILVSKGVKYNARYNGAYSIFSKNTNNNIYYKEPTIIESTEKLAEIVARYEKFDLHTTSLVINLEYINGIYFNFSLYVTPVINNKTLVSFSINDNSLVEEQAFLAFIDVCKETFDRLGFTYGSIKNEYQDNIPLDEDTFLEKMPDVINFYSQSLISKLGRDKLLSAPAYKVEELSNGGIMLLICNSIKNCSDYDIDRVSTHLGYHVGTDWS